MLLGSECRLGFLFIDLEKGKQQELLRCAQLFASRRCGLFGRPQTTHEHDGAVIIAQI